MRQLSLVALGVMVLISVAACSSSSGAARTSASPAIATTTDGVVFGGIDPCSALPPSPTSNLPQYAAGVVTVLRGNRVQARETVQTNALYRFELEPGSYVLQAAYPPPANIFPLTSVTVVSGTTIEADVPNVCK